MKKRILIAPLNWGLGHASRCIPIIDFCLKKGHEVLIGGNGESLELLKKEFPEVSVIEFPSFEIKYYSFIGFQFSIVSQLPKLFAYLRKEKLFTEKIIESKKVDLIISDNRYGLHSKLVPSAIITHQLRFKLGPLSSPATKLINSQLEKFNQCWVPDFPNRPLSGDLSKTNSKSIKPLFIGGLSRFLSKKEGTKIVRDFLVVLSGPEPSRTKFEKKIVEILNKTEHSYKIIRGTDKRIKGSLQENFLFSNRVNSEELIQEINQSKYIISRSGYSSILDLTALNKKAILVPTKGQVEQEYLSDLHNRKGRFICFQENKIDLKSAISYFEENRMEEENSAYPKTDFRVIEEFLNS